jgi:site-specific recombinase XerC
MPVRASTRRPARPASQISAPTHAYWLVGIQNCRSGAAQTAVQVGEELGQNGGYVRIRWMQEIRRFKPSTVSRRFSVLAGFYRTCVIDGQLENSPAEHVRRPTVPAESPNLGFTHLQFEALRTAARVRTLPPLVLR